MSSPLDRPTPPAGEDIHLPGPSLQPLAVAVGVTLVLVGITTFPILWVTGLILTLVATVKWIADTRRDIDELPLEHHG